MKKRYVLPMIFLGCQLLFGCNAAESETVAEVVEIPIETTAEPVTEEAAEVLNQEDILLMAEQESTAFEDIEVEVAGDKGTILVGTTGAPFTELLTQAKILLAKDGWDLQIKYYDNYVQLNEDVLNETLDAHLFAHQTYIDSYNDVNKTELVCVAPVCYEVYGIYSKLNQDLTEIAGASIALPEEMEKKARALIFMQDIGWITLKEEIGMTSILEDVMTNEYDLQFTEYTQDTLTSALDENDYCIIGADTAILCGLDAEDDVLRAETENSISSGIYATTLVTTQEKAEDAKIQVLADTLSSDVIKDYVDDTYKGALELLD